MRRKIVIAIVVVILVLGILAGVRALQIRALITAAESFAPPPETVSSVVLREEKWEGTIAAIATITAVQGVTITPDIPGTVREIAFEAGALVSQGDLLVRLDTSSEEAQLRVAEAQTELARLTIARARNLRTGNSISQSELDDAEAKLKQTQAGADVVRVMIEKKTIRAPFAGRLGIRLVNLGQYVETGKPIVSLQSLESVYAEFALPQQELARLHTGMRVRLSTDAYPGRLFDGTLTTINPALEAATRSIGLQATFDNPDQLLRPGMFARAEVLLPEEQTVLVIPATAVLSAAYGDSVYVIESKPAKGQGKAELVVRQQFIRTGAGRGDFVSVESGLKPGERIVSSGVFKLRNGMSIVENNDLVPKAEQAPRLADS